MGTRKQVWVSWSAGAPLIANMGELIFILRMLAILFFRCMNSSLSNHTNQRHQHRKWCREDNKLVLHCYFRTNPTQKGFRKRIIEIWEEYTRFHTTIQRLADQVWTIIKKGWFSDLEIREIRQKTNSELTQQDTNTVTDTPNTEKQEHSNRNELQSNKNQHTTHLNHTKQTQTQEEEINIEIFKENFVWKED